MREGLFDIQQQFGRQRALIRNCLPAIRTIHTHIIPDGYTDRWNIYYFQDRSISYKPYSNSFTSMCMLGSLQSWCESMLLYIRDKNNGLKLLPVKHKVLLFK